MNHIDAIMAGFAEELASVGLNVVQHRSGVTMLAAGHPEWPNSGTCWLTLDFNADHIGLNLSVMRRQPIVEKLTNGWERKSNLTSHQYTYCYESPTLVNDILTRVQQLLLESQS